MLPNVITQIETATHIAIDAVLRHDFVGEAEKKTDLVLGDSAQFAAGLLYAYSNQTVDARDYLVKCSTQVNKLDNKLEKAFTSYTAEDYHMGNYAFRKMEDPFRRSMVDCHDTNQYFEEIASTAHTFFEQYVWREIMKENYAAEQALVDQYMQDYLTSWDQGVYFNAGMFYGRVWN